jgi:quercetin dioxygenase-like cupin family protein
MMPHVLMVLVALTTYVIPANIHWIPITGRGVAPGGTYAVLRGNETDKCGQIYRMKFPNGYVYPWHVNNMSGIYTVLKGTLVIGFEKNHAKSAERVLPAGSIIEGLATEPHYGRAIGDVAFDFYQLCPEHAH